MHCTGLLLSTPWTVSRIDCCTPSSLQAALSEKYHTELWQVQASTQQLALSVTIDSVVRQYICISNVIMYLWIASSASKQGPRLKLQIYYSRNSIPPTWGMTWLRFPDNAAWGQGTVPLPCQPPQGYTVHTPAVGCYVGGGSRWRRGSERAAVTPVCMCVKCVWGGEVCGCGCVSGCGCMCACICAYRWERRSTVQTVSINS